MKIKSRYFPITLIYQHLIFCFKLYSLKEHRELSTSYDHRGNNHSKHPSKKVTACLLQPQSHSTAKKPKERQTPFEKADNLSPEPANGNMQTSTKA